MRPSGYQARSKLIGLIWKQYLDHTIKPIQEIIKAIFHHVMSRTVVEP
jgi:hypothetical protein